MTRPLPTAARRSHVGTLSLLAAVAGAVGCRIAFVRGPLAGTAWVGVLAAGFEAGVVGGLADWFAVTALFRHPLGIPIPHTAIIPARRAKIVDSIVAMLEDEWLSPDIIGARLARMAPSELIVDWLRDPVHAERFSAPWRDLLRAAASALNEPEVARFLDRALREHLRALPDHATIGRWIGRALDSSGADAAFDSAARSLLNLVRRPGTSARLQHWLDRSARQLRRDGQRLVPLILGRKVVQRKVVEATCEYVTAELSQAVAGPAHPLRQFVFAAGRRFADRLAEGDADTVAQAEQLRTVLVESLDAEPLLRDLLSRLRRQLEDELAHPASDLSQLVVRRLRAGVLDLLADADRRAAFDRWVRATANDLLRRHHHQIGLTVREHLEALDTGTLVAQIEDRVGADLQFIRLNGALVGGVIGVLLALLHRAIG